MDTFVLELVLVFWFIKVLYIYNINIVADMRTVDVSSDAFFVQFHVGETKYYDGRKVFTEYRKISEKYPIGNSIIMIILMYIY